MVWVKLFVLKMFSLASVNSVFLKVAINCGCYIFSMYSALIVGAVSAVLSLIFEPIINGL